MKDHFDKIYWFIVGATLFVFAYTTAITFIPIPKENVRFADVAQGFLLGSVLGAGLAYLVGGTPVAGKKPTGPGSTTAEISATITQEPTTQEQEDTNG